ncbi:hypothetical protein NL676_012953 [Syzygium grande]|nr:hypothetical protein NL676_012953 [Syzygium grande]
MSLYVIIKRGSRNFQRSEFSEKAQETHLRSRKIVGCACAQSPRWCRLSAVSALPAAFARHELLLNRAAAVAPADAVARHPLLSACALVAPLLVLPSINDYPE